MYITNSLVAIRSFPLVCTHRWSVEHYSVEVYCIPLDSITLAQCWVLLASSVGITLGRCWGLFRRSVGHYIGEVLGNTLVLHWLLQYISIEQYRCLAWVALIEFTLLSTGRDDSTSKSPGKPTFCKQSQINILDLIFLLNTAFVRLQTLRRSPAFVRATGSSINCVTTPKKMKGFQYNSSIKIVNIRVVPQCRTYILNTSYAQHEGIESATTLYCQIL